MSFDACDLNETSWASKAIDGTPTYVWAKNAASSLGAPRMEKSYSDETAFELRLPPETQLWWPRCILAGGAAFSVSDPAKLASSGRFLLVIAGVETNPGPTSSVKCTVCAKPCSYKSKPGSIGCGDCGKWQHYPCIGMSYREFAKFAKTKEKWVCKSCNNKNRSLREVKIIQWNAGGLSVSKTAELTNFLNVEKPEVIMIQETKLQPHRKFKQPGYSVIRRDRKISRSGNQNQILGGGVATLVKEGLPYKVIEEDLTYSTDDCTEYLTVRIFPSVEHPITLVNVYIIPIKNITEDVRTQDFNPINWPDDEDRLYIGDMNGHSPLWDDNQPKDDIGEIIEDWITDNNFNVGNTGEATRINPGTGGRSAPDLCLFNSTWSNKITWKMAGDLGSDHSTIETTIKVKKEKVKKSRPRATFSYKKADWNKFREVLDNQITEHWQPNKEKKVKIITPILQNCILKAAKKAIPKGSRINPKNWWCNELDQLVEKRKTARQEAHLNNEKRKIWMDLVAETREAITRAKQKSWQEFSSGLNARTDPKKVWRTIHSLNGKSAPRKKDAVITKNGKDYISSAQKAEIFIKEYSKVSHVKAPKRSQIRRKTSILLKNNACEHTAPNICSPFSLVELKMGMKKLKKNKAAGNDVVSNDMLLNLSTNGIKALLFLFNKSWKQKKVPNEWKKAIIIPILKPAKEPTNPGSYRPISLTSAIAKLMERLVANRLQHWLESKHLLSPAQAGFRKNRGTEDQIAYMVQSITDGFQAKPPNRTILTTIDYSRAFDTVWKDALFYKMAKLGIANCMIKWIRDFLSDRIAKVEIDNATSRYKLMRNGLPQGAVLSPILFCIFINDLPDIVADDPVKISLYADDLAVWSSNTNINVAKSEVQNALNKIETWVKKWNMAINVEKCETCLFTTAPREARSTVSLQIGTNQVPFNKTPKFLGITLDRTLTMSTHIDNIREKMTNRIKPLLALSGTSWGCKKEELRQVYIQYIRSVADYAIATWHSASSTTQAKKIDTIQNTAARIITGCVKSTPIEELLTEASIQPIEVRAKEQTAICLEKSLRLPTDNLRSEIANQNINQRLKSQSSWRKEGNITLNEQGLRNIQREKLLPTNPIPPWNMRLNIDIKTSLSEPIDKTDPEEKKQAATKKTIEQLPQADLECWSDGSAVGGTTNGGAGVLILNHLNTTRKEISLAAGSLVHSTIAELMAVEAALRESQSIREENPQVKEIRICLDSKAALQTLESGPLTANSETEARTWKLIQNLSNMNCHITMQWVPSHCGIEHNEEADKLAKLGTLKDQSVVPTIFAAVKAKIKENLKPKSRKTDLLEQGIPKKLRRALAQLRCRGHSPLTNKYLHKIGKADSPLCQHCRVEDSVTHLLNECCKYDDIRPRQTDLVEKLHTDPITVAKFLEGTGLL